MIGGRKTWIDVLKFLAIIGVLVDHSYVRLYHNPIININSLYAVPLFIFVSGYNAYFSEQRYVENKEYGFVKIFFEE